MKLRKMTNELIKFRKELNKHFLIKLNSYGSSRLVGFKGLCEAVNDDKLLLKIIEGALGSPEDVYKRRLRRGLTIRFYSK